MIEEFLQLRLDQALATCRQRWGLGGIAVASIVVASALSTLWSTSAEGAAIMLLASAIGAVVAISTSGSHLGAAVVAFVTLQWLAFSGGTTGPRVIGVALCLFVFHGLLALMAAVPHTAAIDGRVLRRWATRSVSVAAATGAVWGLIVVFEGRRTSGNEFLTVAGLVAIAAVLVSVRSTYAAWWRIPDRRAGVTGSGTRPSGRGSTTS